MKTFDLKTTKLCKSPTRISKLYWDLAEDHLDRLHVKMIGIQLGFSEIAWGSKGQWWLGVWGVGERGEDYKSIQLRDVETLSLALQPENFGVKLTSFLHL